MNTEVLSGNVHSLQQLITSRRKFGIINIIFIITLFFISNTFISNARLKLAKNEANAKQHSEAELLLLLEIIHILYPRYHLKIIGHILKNKQTAKYICLHEIIRLMIMKMQMKMKNRS